MTEISFIDKLKELTDVDFERDSTVFEQAQLRSLLTQFMEDEARSGSMDFGCVTPIYVYRMFGGQYSITDIENGLTELREQGVFGLYHATKCPE